MDEMDVGFEADLRISSKPVHMALAFLGASIVFLANPLAPGPVQLQQAALGSLVIALALVGWHLEARESRFGRWLAVVILVALTCLGGNRWGVDVICPLLSVPVCAAAALIGMNSALAITSLESVLLLVAVFTGELKPAVLVSALAGIWTVLVLLNWMNRATGDVAEWSWRFFERARRLLKEARDSRLELGQALDDLADANRQLTRLNITAHGLRQAAEDARRAKEEFVANVSHELRTPLNMITGFSEMILQSPETYGDGIPSVLLADLEVIHRNAEHLSDLIDDVLDLSQIETQQMALTKEYAMFDEIVTAAVTAVRPLYEAKGLYLEVDLEQDLPPLLCDSTRVREVLLNLLSNAGRFTEEGGVQLKARQQGDDLVVTVSDTGPGIPADGMSKLFRPFQQLDGSIRRRYGGSGLGLSISKRLIELHGGRIWVESEEGIGTTFCFRLPISPARESSRGYTRWLDRTWEFVERTHPPKAPKSRVIPRIVVVDSGQSLRRLLARYMDGVEVVPVCSLEAAAEELRRVPSLALLVNGSSVSGDLERLRSLEALPNGTLSIVCAVPGIRSRSQELGASDILVKPITRDEVLGALRRLSVESGTVLIVDDEPDALQLFGRMLASTGGRYRVLLARDGAEALQVLRHRKPDAILLDLVMPNVDGFEFLERRAQNQEWRDIPLVITSAKDPAGHAIISNALGVTCKGGLSARQLLAGIQALTQALSAGGGTACPTQQEAPAG